MLTLKQKKKLHALFEDLVQGRLVMWWTVQQLGTTEQRGLWEKTWQRKLDSIQVQGRVWLLHVHLSVQSPPAVLGAASQLEPELSNWLGGRVKKIQKHIQKHISKRIMKTVDWEKMEDSAKSGFKSNSS